MKIIIQSFPRSGANFLANNLRHACKNYVGITHHHSNLNSEKIVIHLIRNPIDSIASIIWVNEKINGMSDMGIDSQVQMYIKMYEFILSRQDYIMCFDKLISDPDKAISDFLAYQNIEYTKHPIELTVDRPDVSFYSSSRDNTRYQDIKDAGSKYQSGELDYCNQLYLEAKALCA